MTPLALAVPILAWEFAATDGGFVANGDVGQWEYGVPATGPGGFDRVWGTNLVGFYLHDATDFLEVPLPPLVGITRPTLLVRHWYAIAPGDLAVVEVDDGSGYNALAPIYGDPDAAGFTGSAGWHDVSFDLSGLGDAPRARLAFSSDLAVADDGWYVARVSLWDGDVTPPRLVPRVEPEDTQHVDATHVVEILAEDDDRLADIELVWTVGAVSDRVAMTPFGNGMYRAEIPAQPPDTRVGWWVEATDAAGNLATYPEDSERSFRVFLAAPTDFAVASDDRAVGSSVVVAWAPPSSPNVVVGYRLQDIEERVAPLDVPDTEAEIVLGPDAPRTWRVAALYEAGRGDWSTPLTLTLEVPELRSMTPASAASGETIHLRVVGSSLYLVDGVSTLDVGDGVSVLDVAARDASTLEALVQVDSDALPGWRDLVVSGAHGTSTFPNAFLVLDGSVLPTILSVSPESVRQGDAATFVLNASQPFAGPVEVQVDDDLVLASPARVDGDEVEIDLVVRTSARLGPHPVLLDDGLRRWNATVQVEERTYATRSGACGTTPPGASWVTVLIALGCRRRRADAFGRSVPQRFGRGRGATSRDPR